MSDAERLLDPEFVQELDALYRRLSVRARSGGPGAGVTRRRGSSAEFHEHRAYAPGDDPRRIDWLAFARTGTPVTKLYRAEEDTVVRVVLDTSASLDFGTPSKFMAAQRLAAAVCYIALRAGQRAQLLVTRPPSPERNSASTIEARRPVRGASGIARVLHDVARLAPEGASSVARAIDAAAEQHTSGMLVVVSDFFDPQDVSGALKRAKAIGHDLALLQVLAPEEVSPTLEGDFRLVDAETGAAVELTVDGPALRAYLQRLSQLTSELASVARKLGASYVRLESNERLESALQRFVARSVDSG